MGEQRRKPGRYFQLLNKKDKKDGLRAVFLFCGKTENRKNFQHFSLCLWKSFPGGKPLRTGQRRFFCTVFRLSNRQLKSLIAKVLWYFPCFCGVTDAGINTQPKAVLSLTLFVKLSDALFAGIFVRPTLQSSHKCTALSVFVFPGIKNIQVAL